MILMSTVSLVSKCYITRHMNKYPTHNVRGVVRRSGQLRVTVIYEGTLCYLALRCSWGLKCISLFFCCAHIKEHAWAQNMGATEQKNVLHNLCTLKCQVS